MVNRFRFEQADDRLGERVIEGIATTTDGRLDAGVAQAFAVANGYILRSPVAVMDQRRVGVAFAERLLEGRLNESTQHHR